MSQMTLDFSAAPVAEVLSVGHLRRAGLLAPIDHHFADALTHLAPGASGVVQLTAAALSRGVRQGHVCLDLAELAGTPVVGDGGDVVPDLVWPERGAWMQALSDSDVVGPGCPLVLEGTRVYLQRYWDHERALAAALNRRASAEPFSLDVARARSTLDDLFPSGARSPDWQKVAAGVALRRALCVVTGGPGTGKTTTVVKILLALARQQQGGSPPRVLMLAPTGKAAARLTDAVNRTLAGMEADPGARGAIPAEASTIHRALGSIRGSGVAFRHGPGNPLPADVVVVDEASMVDLALMRRLVDAVSSRARLILLGDRDQLASVEAGAVLGDICNVGHAWGRSAPARNDLALLTGEDLSGPERAPAIADCIVELQHSWRFGSGTAIGRLAAAVNAGDDEAVLAVLEDPDADGVRLYRPPPTAEAVLHDLVLDRYAPYLEPGLEPRERLERLDGFRILCAHREGRRGVNRVNLHAEEALASAGLIDPSRRIYAGRPVLVTRNDHAQRLYNGDIGVVVEAAEGLQVAFPVHDGPRLLSPSRLPPHETVYAMSVHKSQGSEFDAVAVVLPDAASRVLSRELLYTALTRARHQVFLHGDVEVIRSAVARRVTRSSGLRDRLWST